MIFERKGNDRSEGERGERDVHAVCRDLDCGTTRPILVNILLSVLIRIKTFSRLLLIYELIPIHGKMRARGRGLGRRGGRE